VLFIEIVTIDVCLGLPTVVACDKAAEEREACHASYACVCAFILHAKQKRVAAFAQAIHRHRRIEVGAA
jgi:hypothetical protein